MVFEVTGTPKFFALLNSLFLIHISKCTVNNSDENKLKQITKTLYSHLADGNVRFIWNICHCLTGSMASHSKSVVIRIFALGFRYIVNII